MLGSIILLLIERVFASCPFSVCPQPPNPWVVAGSILGGVVFLGLIILTLIKIIIYFISRKEVKEWEKERNKTAITCVSCIKDTGSMGFVCVRISVNSMRLKAS